MTNNCKTCGDPKEMYDKPWCPRCDVENVTTMNPMVNVIQALRHIEVTKNDPGYPDRLWPVLLENYNFTNDSCIYFKQLDLKGQQKADFELFVNLFSLHPGVLLKFRW